jgi:hypothetical protein
MWVKISAISRRCIEKTESPEVTSCGFQKLCKLLSTAVALLSVPCWLMHGDVAAGSPPMVEHLIEKDSDVIWLLVSSSFSELIPREAPHVRQTRGRSRP